MFDFVTLNVRYWNMVKSPRLLATQRVSAIQSRFEQVFSNRQVNICLFLIRNIVVILDRPFSWMNGLLISILSSIF